MPTNEERVTALMTGYVPTSSDADEIAVEIATDAGMNSVLTRQQRLALVQGLFDGETAPAEEQAAVSILLAAETPDLRWLVKEIGWEVLEDELANADIATLRGVTGDLTGFIYTDDNSDEIASQIANSPSMLQTFKRSQKVRLVKALFDGGTSEKQEDDAMRILNSLSDAELSDALEEIGWAGLEDELDNDDIASLRTRANDFSELDPTDSDSAALAFTLSQNPAALDAMNRRSRATLVKALLLAADEYFLIPGYENAVLTIIRSEPSGEGILQLICDAGGWKLLKNALAASTIDDLTLTITERLDTDNAVLMEDLMFGEGMPWLYDQQLDILSSPFGPSMQSIVSELSTNRKFNMLRNIVSRRESLLWQIASLRRRGKPFPIDALVRVLGWLCDALEDPTSLIAAQGARLRHEVRYMNDLAMNLAEADYAQLLTVLPDLVDAELPVEQRVGLFEILHKLEPELAAQKEAGTSPDLSTLDQRSKLQRFHNYLDASLAAFDPNLPAQTGLEQLIDALKGLGEEISGGLEELRTLIAGFADDILHLNLLELLGANEDDRARQLIGILSAQQDNGTSRLARLPFQSKHTLVSTCLTGATYDDDEDAILKLLNATLKLLNATDEIDRAEFFQLVHSIGFGALTFSIDGEQFWSFMALFECGPSRIGTSSGRLVALTESTTGTNELFRDTWTGRVFSREELSDAIQLGKFSGYRVRTRKGRRIPVSAPDGRKDNNLGRQVKSRLIAA